MRRFLLKSETGKAYECVIYGNGCVGITIAPAYRTHYCSLDEFKKALCTHPDDTITWIDGEHQESDTAGDPTLFNIFLVSCGDSFRGNGSARDLSFIHDAIKGLLDTPAPIAVCQVYKGDLCEQYIPESTHIQVQLKDSRDSACLEAWCKSAEHVGLIKGYTKASVIF